GILPMSSRSVLNHSQQVGGPTGQSGGMGGVGVERGGGGVGGGRSSSMGSPSRSSPSIIGMPKQQQARQPFTINSMSGFGVNRNPGYNMNNSLSNNIFNGT
ncbi:CCR4-NOT transcription complex subunit 2-like, partial [Plectropomus leopardus]|uniref:CCR4-NOT transcription complex subunit 2-like n=1 Tax=Plectropomus leopardus TaxID=160734 RepID=UPI001C4D1515